MTIDIKRAIDITSRFGHLQAHEAEVVMNQIMAGDTSPSQIGAYLMALRMKGETQAEITGSARAMRSNATRIPTQTDPTRLLDTAGTGGDRSGTFNISTTVAFVAAGAGVPVAKHGNRAATSKSGSADVLEALGVDITLEPEQVAQCVDEIGIGFLYARSLHPAMKHVAGARRDMGIRTIFNILGPLTNPAGARRQLMGVFASDLVPFLANVLNDLGTEAAAVVNGYGGLDELTTTGPNQVTQVMDGRVESYEIDPVDYGFSPASIKELLGGEPHENAQILRGILEGSIDGTRRDVVVLNAGMALYVAGVAEDLTDGLEKARHSIDSGAAVQKLDSLVIMSQDLGAA